MVEQAGRAVEFPVGAVVAMTRSDAGFVTQHDLLMGAKRSG